MKEVYIISLYPPEGGSGIEKVVHEISKGIAAASYNIRCTCVFSGKENIYYSKNNINYISIKVPQYPGINHFFLMLKLGKILKNNRIDILLDNIGASAYYLLFHKKKFKLIPVLHGTGRDYYKLAKFFHFKNIIEKIKYYAYSWFNMQCGNMIINKSDKIITLSKYLANDINKYNHINMDKIKVIYNGYDKTNLEFISNKNKKLDILFISNDHARKGIDILEDVANHYINNENINFYVIGSPYNSIIHNIHGLGKINREKLYKIMTKSDIIFLPSYCEGQPLVIFEAMALGCIPLISKECHMDMLEGTVFENNISSCNEYLDYITIIENILQSKDIDDLRTESQAIINKYSWETQAKEYVDFINTVI